MLESYKLLPQPGLPAKDRKGILTMQGQVQARLSDLVQSGRLSARQVWLIKLLIRDALVTRATLQPGSDAHP